MILTTLETRTEYLRAQLEELYGLHCIPKWGTPRDLTRKKSGLEIGTVLATDPDVILLDANVDGTGDTISGKTVYTLDQVIANMNRTSYPGTGIPGPGVAHAPRSIGRRRRSAPDRPLRRRRDERLSSHRRDRARSATRGGRGALRGGTGSRNRRSRSGEWSVG